MNNISLNKILPIFLLFFCFTTVFNVNAQEKRKILNLGNISENNFLLSEEMYGILFNPSQQDYVSLQIHAKNYCKENLGDNYTSLFFQPLGKYTIYFVCEIRQKIDQYNLTSKEKLCFDYLQYGLENKSCSAFHEKLSSIYKEIKISEKKVKKYQQIDFIVKLINPQQFNQIKELEKKAEIVNFFESNQVKLKQELTILQNSLSEQIDTIKLEQKLKHELLILQNPLTEQIDTNLANRNIKLCKLYEFVEGSELYFECILTLIESHITRNLKEKIDFNK